MSEQERANQLAHDIDRLLAGEQVPGREPLLEAVRQFATRPLQPGLQAQQRFEQQLATWFGGPSAPPIPRHWSPPRAVTAALWLVVGAILGFVLASRSQQLQGPPTSLPTTTLTVTLSPSFTPTTVPTETVLPTPTETHAATSVAPTMTSTMIPVSPSAVVTMATPTPLTFIRIIVSGSIESIQGQVIKILGQSITVEGGVGGLCQGDFVQLEAILQDGVYHAQRTAVKIETSSCPTPKPSIDQSGGSNVNGGSKGSGNDAPPKNDDD